LEGFEKFSKSFPYFYNTPKTKRILVISLVFSSHLKTLANIVGDSPLPPLLLSSTAN